MMGYCPQMRTDYGVVHASQRLIVRVKLRINHENEGTAVVEYLRLCQGLSVKLNLILKFKVSRKIPNLKLDKLVVGYELDVERICRLQKQSLVGRHFVKDDALD